jgi:hypothetical protein
LGYSLDRRMDLATRKPMWAVSEALNPSAGQ